MPRGLPERLRLAFLTQAAVGVVIILVGAYIAMVTAERDVAARALKDEAAYFWQQRADNPLRSAPP